MIKTERFCDVCGAKYDEFDYQCGFNIVARPKYGSKYDGCKVMADLCCSCFDRMMDFLQESCVDKEAMFSQAKTEEGEPWF